MAAGTHGRIASCPRTLTAGDLARALDIDLKTVHNWVRRGVLSATRTEGGHLRFQRMQVIRALRGCGRGIPPGLALAWPEVLWVGFGREAATGDAAVLAQSLLDAALRLVAEEHDVLVLNLDAFRLGGLCELVSAVRRHPRTQHRGLVGVSASSVWRQAFLQAGGDLAVSSADQLGQAVCLVTGAGTDLGGLACGTRRSGEYLPGARPNWDPARLAG